MRHLAWLRSWAVAFAFLFLGASCGDKFSFDQLAANARLAQGSPDASNPAPDKCKPGTPGQPAKDDDDYDDDRDTDQDGKADCDDDDDDDDGIDDDDDDDSDGDGVSDVMECAAV